MIQSPETRTPHRSSAHSCWNIISDNESRKYKIYIFFPYLGLIYAGIRSKNEKERVDVDLPPPQEWNHWQCWRVSVILQGFYPLSCWQQSCTQGHCRIRPVNNHGWKRYGAYMSGLISKKLAASIISKSISWSTVMNFWSHPLICVVRFLVSSWSVWSCRGSPR